MKPLICNPTGPRPPRYSKTDGKGATTWDVFSRAEAKAGVAHGSSIPAAFVSKVPGPPPAPGPPPGPPPPKRSCMAGGSDDLAAPKVASNPGPAMGAVPAMSSNMVPGPAIFPTGVAMAPGGYQLPPVPVPPPPVSAFLAAAGFPPEPPAQWLGSCPSGAKMAPVYAKQEIGSCGSSSKARPAAKPVHGEPRYVAVPVDILTDDQLDTLLGVRPEGASANPYVAPSSAPTSPPPKPRPSVSKDLVVKQPIYMATRPKVAAGSSTDPKPSAAATIPRPRPSGRDDDRAVSFLRIINILSFCKY